MRFLVPAASAALITVVTLSATTVSALASETRPAQAGVQGAQRPAVPNVAGPPGPATPDGADLAAARVRQVAPRGDFAWPLWPRPRILRRFKQPQNQWSPGHRGVDLSAAVGQPVLSAGAGVVAFSGVVAGRGVVVVRHPGGLRTTYDAVDERLVSGAVVYRGDRIGVVSPAPGHCAPLTCLHWGAISTKAYRDPLSLLRLAAPILLPLG